MNLIIYLILLIAAGIFYPLYENELSFGVLVTLIIIPFVLAASLIYNVKTIKAAVSGDSGTVFMHRHGSVRIRITNKGIIPAGGVEVAVRTESLPLNKQGSEIICMNIGVHSSSTAHVTADTSHCGVFRVYIDHIRLSDILGLFSHKIKVGSTMGEIVIIPELDPDSKEEALSLIKCAAQFVENNNEPRPVSGPGDVIDFRDYRPGDRPVLIHHKLSARFDKNIVKVMGLSQSRRFLTAPEDISERTPDETDKLLSRALSIAYYIGEAGCESYAALSEDAGECLPIRGGYAMKIGGIEDYVTAARSIVLNGAGDLNGAAGFICSEVGIKEDV